MIERTGDRFGLKPQRLAGDTAYGAAPMLNWLVEEKQIAPRIPVFDRSKREDGTFSREDFHYDGASDTYTCPEGKTLTTTGRIDRKEAIFYRASSLDCAKCHLKPKCCPNSPQRRVPRSIYEHARDVARSWVGTEAFEQSRRERRRMEMRFAHLKRILQARPASITRSPRCTRRVHPGGNRSEPQADGKADNANPCHAGLASGSRSAGLSTEQRRRPVAADFCNAIGTTPTFRLRKLTAA